MIRALLVEDDRKLAELVAEYLGKNGLEVRTESDAEGALQALGRERFDVVLLDLTLPGMDGLELLPLLRSRWQIPTVLVSARRETDDRVRGLDLGADDYLPKPFDPRELLARIRAVLRRQPAPGRRAVYRLGELEIDLDAREVERAGQRITVTTHEFELLSALVQHAGRVLSREQLLESMKGQRADESFDRSIDVLISRLRQKLEPDPRNPRYIKTVRGAGYTMALGEEASR